MTRLDSRTETINEVAFPYVNSAPIDQDYHWGQPPASYYSFIVLGNTLRGQPVSDIREAYLPSHDIALDDELQAWDALSDEALMCFEQELG